MEKEGDLMQGTLDMLVLKALARGSKALFICNELWLSSARDRPARQQLE